MNKTRIHIMTAAEKMIRTGGYNGFSFREIADSVGIKSASVHHHFAKKEDLVSAVMQQYGETFFILLGDALPAGSNSSKQIKAYCSLFLKSFESTGRSCLCAVLSNEAEQLPINVKEKVMEFVDQNIIWLQAALGGGRLAKRNATLIYCTLEGAMGVAAVEQHSQKIKQTTKALLELIGFDSK